MIAEVALGGFLAAPMTVVGLIPVIVLRWLIEGWQPATIPDEPYDFARETWGGIPAELLDLT